LEAALVIYADLIFAFGANIMNECATLGN